MKTVHRPHGSRFLLILAVFLIGITSISAQTNSASAEEIMLSVYERAAPSDLEAELTMTLKDSRGRERVRELKQVSASFSGVDKKIMEFRSPADVRGTSFMNWSYSDSARSDDQWIYLPALKRVRRISSEGKGDSFMGSDFSYDDLGTRHPDRDTHRILGSENIEGEACWIIESTPKDASGSYSKIVSWVSKERTMGLKRDYYDRSGKLLKTLRVLETREINDYLMITHTEMHNVQKDHRTSMEFESMKVDSDIGENQFTERAMTRGL